jgi:hypothetical protein
MKRLDVVIVFSLCSSACTALFRDPAAPDMGGDASGPGSSHPNDAGAVVDAEPLRLSVTLSQTANNAITSQSNPACGKCNNTTSNPCNDFVTAEDSWYRVFDLADHQIAEPFRISQITFGVLQAMGTQSVDVKIGNYNGALGATLDLAAVTPLASATVNVPTMTYYAPIPVPMSLEIQPGTKFIVEVHSPSHIGQTNTYFFIGATHAGEIRPGYLRWPVCGKTVPNTLASLGYPSENIIITVTGSYEL